MEGRREKEREKHQLVVPLTHSLVDSRMCPDPGTNPQPW